MDHKFCATNYFLVKELIAEIISHQNSCKIMVTFEKVQAHSGEFGNCQADKHAKNGLRRAIAIASDYE